jgi:hypothetical protein
MSDRNNGLHSRTFGFRVAEKVGEYRREVFQQRLLSSAPLNQHFTGVGPENV